MPRPYYIFSSGRLRRKHNTLYLEPSGAPEEVEEEPQEGLESLELEETDLESTEVPAGVEPPGKEEAPIGRVPAQQALGSDRLASGQGGGGQAQRESAEELPTEHEEAPSESPREKPPHARKIPAKPIPIEDVESLYLMGEIDLNTRLLNFLSQKRIVVHVFNYYGFYTGSYYPRDYLHSGFTLVAQVQHYLNRQLRLDLAREIVDAATYNILKNLQYYQHRERDLSTTIEAVEWERTHIPTANDIPELMAIEGRVRDRYYQAWNDIITADFSFEKRIRRPPDNAINALISFCNMLVYTTALGEIYHTQLHPTISYLHEPGQRRFSLSLDLAEIFKPILADRMIFKLLNQKMLQEKHFDEKLNYCVISEEGRKIILREYDERLNTTIKHRTLGRHVSYRRLIRLECYKLVKHVTGIERYRAFRIWW